MRAFRGRGTWLLGGALAVAFAVAARFAWTSDPWPERVWVMTSPPYPDEMRAHPEVVGGTRDVWQVEPDRARHEWVLQPPPPGAIERWFTRLGLPGFRGPPPKVYRETGLQIAALERLWVECVPELGALPPPPDARDVAGAWDVVRADGVARRVTLARDGRVAGWHDGMGWTRSGRYVTIGYLRGTVADSSRGPDALRHDAVQLVLSEDGRTCDGVDDGGRGVRARRLDGE
jgi:hypothetical protein